MLTVGICTEACVLYLVVTEENAMNKRRVFVADNLHRSVHDEKDEDRDRDITVD